MASNLISYLKAEMELILYVSKDVTTDFVMIHYENVASTYKKSKVLQASEQQNIIQAQKMRLNNILLFRSLKDFTLLINEHTQKEKYPSYHIHVSQCVLYHHDYN